MDQHEYEAAVAHIRAGAKKSADESHAMSADQFKEAVIARYLRAKSILTEARQAWENMSDDQISERYRIPLDQAAKYRTQIYDISSEEKFGRILADLRATPAEGVKVQATEMLRKMSFAALPVLPE